MRGMLMHYLIERGLSHDASLAVADAVRSALGKTEEIKRAPLQALVKQILQDQGAETPPGNLIFWQRLPTAVSVGGDPFSHEHLNRSLEAAGLTHAEAHQMARAIETQLIDQHRTHISQADLENLVIDTLVQEHGKAPARRYRIWRAWRRQKKPLVILIGGASGVGKTTLAVRLANLLDIPRVVATDDIRQIMRLTLAPELLPSIHASSYATQSSTNTVFDDDIAGYREQAQLVSVGVRAIIERCIKENSSVIVDGVHLHPDFVNTTAYLQSSYVVRMVLSISDVKAYKKRFAQRAHEAPAREQNHYLKNLPRILKIQEHLLTAHTENDLPVIDTAAVDDPVFETMIAVAEQLGSYKNINRSAGLLRRKRKKQVVTPKK
jgi:2-phosphoglycerate kinase